MILNKRIFRDFKENITRYLGIILLVLISSMAIVGFANSTDSVIETGSNSALSNNLEDGEFYLTNELNNDTLNKLKDLGVTVEDNSYVDYKIYENQTIRIFQRRNVINKLSINEGKDLENTNEIVIDQHFGEANDYKIFDQLKISNKIFEVVGYGCVPDYTQVIEKATDITPNPKSFGIGFVTEEAFQELKNKNYCYIFKLNGESYDKVRNIVSKNADLESIIKTSDNTRIIGYIDDSQTNKNVAIIVGIVLCIMIGFMISMSLINQIDSESPIIGALYSLGYIKKEILRHFMILPTLIVSIGAISGTFLGFIISKELSATTTSVYSLPNLEKIYSPYLIFVGVVLPILIVIIINYIVISRKLNSTPLQLLRKEKKASKLNTIKIKHFGFITKFRLRELLREIRGNITLFFGLLIATFLLVFGVSINAAIDNYVRNLERETKFNYMYTLSLPINIHENNDIEKITVKNLSIYYKDLNQDMDVVLEGIKENSSFYDFTIKDSDDGIYISEGTKAKFNLKVGDSISLKDTNNNKIYNVKISGCIEGYKTGLYIFMNQKQLNSLLKESKDYFNGYLSKDELNINEDYIYSKVTSNNLIKSAKNMTSMMMPIIICLIIFSTILFIITMYLLLKLMVDKSIGSISLVKIFGFNRKEINKLYLGSFLYTVLISSIIGVPLSFEITKVIYPSLVTNMQLYFFITLSIKEYVFIGIVILGAYLVSNYLLKKHINSISLAEALKNRD